VALRQWYAFGCVTGNGLATALAFGRNVGDDRGCLRPASGFSNAFAARILPNVRSLLCRERAWRGRHRHPFTAPVSGPQPANNGISNKELSLCDDDNGTIRKGD